MEALFLSSSSSSSPTSDQSIYSPNKKHDQIRRCPKMISKSIHSSFNISRSSENFALPHSNLFSNSYGGGGVGRSILYGSSPPLLNQQQPPLLPLPITTKPYSSLPLRNNINNNKNRNRSDQQQDHQHHHNHLSAKKSKSSSTITPKKRDSSPRLIIGKREINTFVIESNKRLGPEPGDLPKEVSRVFKPYLVLSTPPSSMENCVEMEFSAIFSLAPPPSSLPLPKFSLRPKLSCNVEAACVIDDGATDNLRRLLRLR